jgi:DNA-directed RNA polymerase subunit RPC12/RpoP
MKNIFVNKKEDIKCPNCKSTDCQEDKKLDNTVYLYWCTDCGEKFFVDLVRKENVEEV